MRTMTTIISLTRLMPSRWMPRSLWIAMAMASVITRTLTMTTTVLKTVLMPSHSTRMSRLIRMVMALATMQTLTTITTAWVTPLMRSHWMRQKRSTLTLMALVTMQIRMTTTTLLLMSMMLIPRSPSVITLTLMVTVPQTTARLNVLTRAWRPIRTTTMMGSRTP